MTKFHHYTIEELLLEDSFVHYCLATNDQAVEEWDTWLKQYPDQQKKIEAAKKLLFSLGIRLTKEEKQLELEKLKAAVQLEKQNRQLPQAWRPSGKSMVRSVVSIAAAVLLFFAGYQVSNWFSSAPVSNTRLAYEIIHSGNGERKMLELSDGSSVILNSNSRLKIPVDYNLHTRSLELEGEALFEVAPNKKKPFLVRAEQTTVAALGTVFKVRAYAFEPGLQALLLEGKIKLSSAANPAAASFLLPGMQYSAERKTGTVSLLNFDQEQEAAWRKGRLIFRNASLEQIRETLQYWYGMEVILKKNSHKPVRFNGEFDNKELKEVMTAIAYVNNLSYTINENQLTIISR